MRCLVALVAPSAVLRASAEIIGRRASLLLTLLLASCDYEYPSQGDLMLRMAFELVDLFAGIGIDLLPRPQRV